MVAEGTAPQTLGRAVEDALISLWHFLKWHAYHPGQRYAVAAHDDITHLPWKSKPATL